VCVDSFSTLLFGPLLVWAATGETPTWRVFVGAAGITVTMGVEPWLGLRESSRAEKNKGEEAKNSKTLLGGEKAEDESTAAAGGRLDVQI
jgi:hypothetical protein